MEEWKTYKLGSLCKKVCSGGTPKSTCDKYYGGGIPWLNTKEVDFNRIYSTESTISQVGLENSSAKWIDENSVIVAMYGNTAGKVALAKIPLTTNQACCNLMLDQNKADYRFIFYYLSSQYLTIKAMANGAAQQNLNAQQIKDIEVPLPSLRVQHQIADVLSSIDDKIELNNRINHNLEEQAQTLYKSWFVDFDPFKDGKFVESDLGIIPKGWRVGNLSELLDIRYGKDHKKLHDGPYSVYGSGGFMRKVERPLFEGESVLIPRKGTLNNVMYVNEAFWSVDTMFYSVEKMPNIAKYCYQILSQLDLASMNTGSAIPSMTTDILNSIQVVIPDKEVLENYNIILSHIFDLIASIQNENSCLISIRNSILPKLMNGEIIY